MLKLKTDASANIAQTLEISKYQLYFKQTVISVGHGSDIKNHDKEKLYKLSIYLRYLHQYQPFSELLLT